MITMLALLTWVFFVIGFWMIVISTAILCFRRLASGASGDPRAALLLIGATAA
jgi:hypothetical protein